MQSTRQDKPVASAAKNVARSNENYLDDITIYISSQHKEPNEHCHEMKVVDQKWFVFKCGHPPTGFIYFTMASKDGCKLRVSLEYVGPCDPNKQNL